VNNGNKILQYHISIIPQSCDQRSV